MNEPDMTVNQPANRPALATVMAMVPGAFILSLGIISLLVSTGVLHLSLWQLWRFWPLFLVFIGIVNIARLNLASVIWGVALALYGGCFLLDNFGRLPFHAWQLWPIFVVALGAQWLLATVRGEPIGGRGCRSGFGRHGARHFPFSGAVGPGQPLQMTAVFSEAHARVTSADLVEGAALSFFGMCKIDLRSMGIPDHPVTIDASALFGAVEIYIPGTWDVILRGIGLLGAYQDETLPPVPGGNTGSRRGLLIVKGHCTFAAVTVKN